ncbi:phosphotransferase [bacterium]|nr:phosphotransferase [bacterium]
MHIVRSTIAGSEIHRILTAHYSNCLENAVCMLEYRGINDIYRSIEGGVSYFLKIYMRKDMTKESIEAEVEIVNYLWQSGLCVARPIASRDDNYLVSFDTPEGVRYGVLFTEAQGSPTDNDKLDDAGTQAIARYLSTMHSLLDSMPVSPKRWRLDEALFLDASLNILTQYSTFNDCIDLPFLEKIVKEVKAQIRANSVEWKWGLCHGDIYAGNIHRDKHGSLTIIDFDFCGYGWRAYDLASFLGFFGSGIGTEAIEKRKRRLDSFLRGYTCAGGLSEVEIEAVYKTFIPFRRIFNMGYLYESLQYVWGNRLRLEQIRNDQRLLKEWIDYYW